MKIFYCCYGSAHSSVTAANIHLGYLPITRRASPLEILHQPLFDRTEGHQLGEPRLMGRDDWGNEVYVIGLAGGKNILMPALRDFIALNGISREQVLFEDVLIHAGVPLRIGGYTSRRLGLVPLGRPLCVLGVWLKYSRFVEHVRGVHQRVQIHPLELACRIGLLDAAHRERHNGNDTGPLWHR
jgi:hypothetical protein